MDPDFEPDRSPDVPRGALVIEEFASFRELVERCASRLSREGCLVEGTAPEPVGTRVTFELRIRDGFAVLRGEGEVVGSPTPDSDQAASGLAVRFLQLDEASQKLLPSLLGHYRRHGIEPYELPAAEPLAAAPLTSEAAGEQVEPEELTLSELEAEFRTTEDHAHEDATASLQAPEGEAAAEEPELPASGDDGTVVQTAVDSSEESERRRPLLVPADGLAAEMASDRSGEPEPELPEVADEVRLEELSAVETADGEPSRAEPGESEISPAVDPGLSWLPDDSPRRRRKGLWVLLLVLLGMVLAASTYYFLTRGPRQRQQEVPFEPQRSAIGREASEAADVERAGSDLRASSPSPAESMGVSMLAAAAEAGEPEEVVAEPARTQEQPAVPEVDGSELTGIDRITWVEQGESTVVTLWADGEFRLEQIEQERIDGLSPRNVVKIRGVTRPCPEQRVEVGTAHVQRVRTGLHPEASVVELHVVADLVDADVELQRTEADGAQLRFYFSRAG